MEIGILIKHYDETDGHQDLHEAISHVNKGCRLGSKSRIKGGPQRETETQPSSPQNKGQPWKQLWRETRPVTPYQEARGFSQVWRVPGTSWHLTHHEIVISQHPEQPLPICLSQVQHLRVLGSGRQIIQCGVGTGWAHDYRFQCYAYVSPIPLPWEAPLLRC